MFECRPQDLRDTPRAARKYRFHKRGWMREPLRLRWEVVVPRRIRDGSLGLGVRFDATEDDLVLHVAAGPELYVSLHPGDRFWRMLGLDYTSRQQHPDRDVQVFGGERDIGLRVFDGAVWWDVWSMDGCGRSSDPKWMRGNLDLGDLVLGRQEYSKTVLEEHEVDIPMPEGTYRWKLALVERRWTRPRGPTKVAACFEAECLDGEHIPEPGKGTTSYNCGADATFGVSGTAETVEEAIGKIVAGALRDRRKYGGSYVYVSEGKYDEKAA